MKKLLFIIFPILAFIGGAFGGAILREQSIPAKIEDKMQEDSDVAPYATSSIAQNPPPTDSDSPNLPAVGLAWFSFPTQFFIPLMQGGQVSGTMILSLIIEMPETSQDHIREQEHRLRDAMLRALMIHANTGGFEGNFTTEPRMKRLQDSLLSAARIVAGDEITGVLIEDLMRQ